MRNLIKLIFIFCLSISFGQTGTVDEFNRIQARGVVEWTNTITVSDRVLMIHPTTFEFYWATISDLPTGAGGNPVITDDEIVFGTGSGITSSSIFSVSELLQSIGIGRPDDAFGQLMLYGDDVGSGSAAVLYYNDAQFDTNIDVWRTGANHGGADTGHWTIEGDGVTALDIDDVTLGVIAPGIDLADYGILSNKIIVTEERLQDQISGLSGSWNHVATQDIDMGIYNFLSNSDLTYTLAGDVLLSLNKTGESLISSFGINDTWGGQIALYGGSAVNSGAAVTFYNNSTKDTNAEFYTIFADDDLDIYSTFGQNYFSIDPETGAIEAPLTDLADYATLGNKTLVTDEKLQDAISGLSGGSGNVTFNEISSSVTLVQSEVEGFVQFIVTSGTNTLTIPTTTLTTDEILYLNVVNKSGNDVVLVGDTGVTFSSTTFKNADIITLRSTVQNTWEIHKVYSSGVDIEEDVTVLNLLKEGGQNDFGGTAATSDTYTLGVIEVGGYRETLINAASFVGVTGATQFPNTASFIANTDMILCVKDFNGTRKFWFVEF